MHYALFAEWVKTRTNDLVVFGVPLVEAQSLMAYLKRGAEAAESEARGEEEFLRDLHRIGAAKMAERHGMSPQAIHQKKTNINRRLTARLMTP